jgi:hypothetical protein
MIADVARRLLEEKHIFVPSEIGYIELLFFDEEYDYTFVLRYQDEDVGYRQYPKPIVTEKNVYVSSSTVTRYESIDSFFTPNFEDGMMTAVQQNSALFVHEKFRKHYGEYDGFGQYLIMLGMAAFRIQAESMIDLPAKFEMSYLPHMVNFLRDLGCRFETREENYAVYEMPPNEIKEVELKKLK